MTEVVRNLGHEIVVSQSIGLYKNFVMSISGAGIALAVIIDVFDQAHNIYYFRSMIAAIVGGAFIVSMLRYTSDFVDEVRAGPDYLVVRREKRTAIIPIDQVDHVWLNHFFVWGTLVRFAEFLPRIKVDLVRPCIFGSAIAFYPQDNWQTRWARAPMLNMLRAADDPTL